MTRRDLGDSDIMGLNETYRELCAHRRWTAEEANRAMRQTIRRDNKRAAREEADPPSGRETLAICVLILVAVGTVVAFVLEGLKWI